MRQETGKSEVITHRPGYGEIRFPNGDWYEGELSKEGYMNGKGTLICVDGRSYTGEYSNNLRHGKGIFITKEGRNGYKYEGMWKMNKQSGHGVCTWRGAVYEGQYEKGLKHGKGKCTWSDRRLYQGDWCNDLRHGEGVEVWPDGMKYTGEYSNNVRQGRGVFSGNGYRYEGEWKNNWKHGQCVETWHDGKKYEGKFTNNSRDGKIR